MRTYFLVDVRCDDLSIPINGNISCSSGRVGVGYEGGTCSFLCNPGYELAGNDTRTCLNDGSWSSNDIICDCIYTKTLHVSILYIVSHK